MILPDIPVQKTAAGNATLLPNSWRVSPAGRQIPLPGDLPLGMQVSPDGQYLVVATSGFHNQSVSIISLASEKLVQQMDVRKTFYGLAISPDGSAVYLSGGGKLDSASRYIKGSTPEIAAAAAQPVMRLAFAGGQLSGPTGVPLPDVDDAHRYTTGLAISADRALFVANYETDMVSKYSNGGRAPAGQVKVGAHPYALALSPNGKTLAVTNWGGGTISLLNPDTMIEKARVIVGSHPNAAAWAPDGRLFVTNANSNSLSVIRGEQVSETIKTSVNPNDLIGSTPDAVVVSHDGKRLYVANADNNDVAVVDISDTKESKLLGFIPTGWYPSSLALSPDDKRLFVGVGKGLQSHANATPETTITAHENLDHYTYIPQTLSGFVSVVDIPNPKQLSAYTGVVIGNIPNGEKATTQDAKTDAENAFKNIKHIVYIIRENRTYDQVFGDLSEGNGDPRLCLFGEKVTPNAHALARNYVLHDNLYCNGEVSEDGHHWCDGAYATDFTERDYPQGYSDRPILRESPGGSWMATPPSGFLWNECAKRGVTYKNYGEAGQFHSTPGSAPAYEGQSNTAYGRIPFCDGARDMGRAKIFIDDLHEAEKTGHWAQFMVMALPEDHTKGLQAGAYSPFALVGGNDQALGEIVSAISKSKFWSNTAIFVIEDDAQDGPDHVDAHRTVGLIISPYVRPGVDSTMYTTTSYVRTMELILGLPPMTQYDQTATPCYNSFTDYPRLAAFETLPPRVDIAERNPVRGVGATASAKLDFSAPDRADPDKLNEILWRNLKPGVNMPSPVRGAWRSRTAGGSPEDDDD
jgi:YVTN family beta-propeller protein